MNNYILAQNRSVDLLVRTDTELLANKSGSYADTVIEQVFDKHPRLSLLSSCLRATVARKESETRFDSAKFASSLRDPPVDIQLKKQHWQCLQTSCHRLEFQNLQTRSQIF